MYNSVNDDAPVRRQLFRLQRSDVKSAVGRRRRRLRGVPYTCAIRIDAVILSAPLLFSSPALKVALNSFTSHAIVPLCSNILGQVQQSFHKHITPFPPIPIVPALPLHEDDVSKVLCQVRCPSFDRQRARQKRCFKTRHTPVISFSTSANPRSSPDSGVSSHIRLFFLR